MLSLNITKYIDKHFAIFLNTVLFNLIPLNVSAPTNQVSCQHVTHCLNRLNDWTGQINN